MLFFQAEEGIRDADVTGVQTCALPICVDEDALAESGWPEVVLIDTGLPGMDGYEVARRLRASSRGPEMHLLALTGFGQPRDYQRGPGSDFDAYLMKPVDPEELVRTIGTVAPPRG